MKIAASSSTTEPPAPERLAAKPSLIESAVEPARAPIARALIQTPPDSPHTVQGAEEQDTEEQDTEEQDTEEQDTEEQDTEDQGTEDQGAEDQG
ncbi:hypothetical protein RMSM_07672, partial [Rhodopirellula maiorica SM1]